MNKIFELHDDASWRLLLPLLPSYTRTRSIFVNKPLGLGFSWTCPNSNQQQNDSDSNKKNKLITVQLH